MSYIKYADVMSPIWAFDNIENKHTLSCEADCLKRLCISLREHATNVINFEEKKMLSLTNKKLKSHQEAKDFIKFSILYIV